MADNNSGWADHTYAIKTQDGQAFCATVKGRDRWALEQLMYAGQTGCTPINNPAPRWSAYVFNLRGLGIPIETITEAHSGPFSGTHARYVLKAQVTA
jgi:hypothetical protein